ncbi:uncharacterized protein LOC135161549 [Diachasmimorpha longicaudata]|uniref:uncharacterized protein LOC135161549 n=1 Tax=Diachasmimorpha longicaudata TaxID=58733 RepID=UPI0030B90874
MSTDSGLGQTPTPQIQKSFFSTPSSSKRQLFQTQKHLQSPVPPGYESDLGPMSPIAHSDKSSISSSPGRSYHSPVTTPECSPKSQLRQWDRLRPLTRENYRLSPFSSLRKTTREARASPGRRLSSASPGSLPRTPQHLNRHQIIPGTPEGTENMITEDGIIPETPQKSCDITDTPKRAKNPERRLITPLGSVCKSIIVPPLNRRKSLGLVDLDQASSPERLTQKRHLTDDHAHSAGTKLIKTDDALSIPKARASLFPEEKSENTIPFTLSTKSFYNKTPGDDGTRRYSMCFGWRSTETKPKKRYSLPSTKRRSGGHRRPKFGEINAGVTHGIKKPKPRKSLVKTSKDEKGQKVETSESSPQVARLTRSMGEKKGEEQEETHSRVLKVIPVVERPPSPVPDPTKRFFKTNRTIKSRNLATVTVNKNIKLKVADGVIKLNEKKNMKPLLKKPRLEATFDANDLTVDEPEVNNEMQQSDVMDILRVLEDDWGDDEYDTMGPLVNNQAVRSSHVLMSPGSVLSDMTSSMNIADQENAGTEDEGAGGGEKYYPLFSKGFTPAVNDSFDKKPNRGVKRQAWQLSTKANGGIDQYQLDVGQKRFGTTQCLDCGIVYQIGEPEDENAHLNFHNSFKTLKFNGWKNERVVVEDTMRGSRIITIEKTDPKTSWKKVEEVLAVVDRDLGLADMELTDYHDKKIYLYIRNKTILGVLIAEPVKVAHQMIPELVEFDCCSTEESPVKCGVNVIWTAMSHRRQHIATKLLDALRTNYFYGYILSLDDIAFSMPTPTGKIFAEKYTKTRNFKVYS